MTRNISWLLILAACGSDPVVPDDDSGTGTDATVKDSPASDTGSSKDGNSSDTGAMDSSDLDVEDDGGSIDAGGQDGGPMMQCQNANDCKLFSSYCSTDPCKCLPLGKNDPNPICNGQKVTCLIDPCLNKSPFCNNGKCDVQ